MSVLSHDDRWFGKIKLLQEQSGCLVFVYVDPALHAGVETLARSIPDLYIKPAIFYDDVTMQGKIDRKHLTGLETSLDAEYTSLIKLIQPSSTLVMLDSSKADISILQNFKQGLQSGRVGAIIWEHHPGVSTHNALAEEVKMLSKEGYAVYMPSATIGDIPTASYYPLAWSMNDTLQTSPATLGPWLRMDGSYWDDSFEVERLKDYGVTLMAIQGGDSLQKQVDREGLICRKQSRYHLSGVGKWKPTHFPEEVHMSVEERLKGQKEAPKVLPTSSYGACECQEAVFRYIPDCGIHAPPPPHPSGVLDLAIWMDEQKIAAGEIPERVRQVNITQATAWKAKQTLEQATFMNHTRELSAERNEASVQKLLQEMKDGVYVTDAMNQG